MRFQRPTKIPRPHAAAQLIGFARGVVGGEDGELHHLLLEQRDTQGPTEDALQLRRVADLFLAVPPSLVGVLAP